MKIVKCDFCSNISTKTFVRAVDIDTTQTQVDVPSGRTEQVSERYDICVECLARIGLSHLHGAQTEGRVTALSDLFRKAR